MYAPWSHAILEDVHTSSPIRPLSGITVTIAGDEFFYCQYCRRHQNQTKGAKKQIFYCLIPIIHTLETIKK